MYVVVDVYRWLVARAEAIQYSFGRGNVDEDRVRGMRNAERILVFLLVTVLLCNIKPASGFDPSPRLLKFEPHYIVRMAQANHLFWQTENDQAR